MQVTTVTSCLLHHIASQYELLLDSVREDYYYYYYYHHHHHHCLLYAGYPYTYSRDKPCP